MKTSICNLKKSEYKSLSNDKYSIKKKPKGLKSNIENNIIEKKIKAQKEILNTLNKVNKKKIIKREKSEDLILSKTKVPSPEFGRETTSKKKQHRVELENKMKKIISVLSLLCVAASFVSCGADKDDASGSKPDQPTTAEAATEAET